MEPNEEFIKEFKQSFVIPLETKDKVISYIPKDSYGDLLSYIKFDELLITLAKNETDLSIEKKKKILRNYLNTKNVFSWYLDHQYEFNNIPYTSDSLEVILPYNNKQYTPYIEAYFRWMSKLPSLLANKDNPTPISLASKAEVNEHEDEIIKTLINELQSEETFNALKKATKAFHRSKRVMKKYVTNLLDVRANLLVIRLDLSFNKDHIEQNEKKIAENKDKNFNKNFHQSGFTNEQHADAIKANMEDNEQFKESLLADDLAAIKEYRAKFFRQIKARYDVTGFIWKLEYGGEKGFHYHCLIFLNGDDHQEDVNIAKDMGDMWKKITTDEVTNVTQGIYWNCNANKDTYKYPAIGKLHANDKEMIDNLYNYVITYFAKTDYYFKLAKSNDRAIGTGEKKTKVKSGRPRTKDSFR